MVPCRFDDEIHRMTVCRRKTRFRQEGVAEPVFSVILGCMLTLLQNWPACSLVNRYVSSHELNESEGISGSVVQPNVAVDSGDPYDIQST